MAQTRETREPRPQSPSLYILSSEPGRPAPGDPQTGLEEIIELPRPAYLAWSPFTNASERGISRKHAARYELTFTPQPNTCREAHLGILHRQSARQPTRLRFFFRFLRPECRIRQHSWD